jgi:hypothetical protein
MFSALSSKSTLTDAVGTSQKGQLLAADRRSKIISMTPPVRYLNHPQINSAAR